jgi:hypothetical protein
MSMVAPGLDDTLPPQSLISRFARAVADLDVLSKAAIVCLFCAWFLIDTLAVSLGSLRHGVRFFDLAAVIGDPTRMFFGVNRSFQTVLFGAACLLCLLAPVLSHLRPQLRRGAWMGYAAPLGLMLVCGALLYAKSAGETFAAPSDSHAMTGNFIRFANGLVHQGGAVVAKHVAVGAGGYLALAAGLALAVQGIRLSRHAAR